MTMTDFKIFLISFSVTFVAFLVVSYVIHSITKSIQAYHPDKLKTNPSDTADLEADTE